MNLPDIIKGLRGIFERKRKNPLQLDNDSNLESNLKPLKVSNKSTPLQISEDTVDVKGSLKVNGVDVSTEPDEAGSGGASSLDELSDVAYSSGDLSINLLDTIVAPATLTIDAGGDIVLDADGGDVFIKDNGSTLIQMSNNAILVGEAQYGNSTITYDGDDLLEFATEELTITNYLKIAETANANSDTEARGQIWVKNDTPNCLAFTDDAGTDIIGVGKYHYETKVIGFFAGQTASFLPMTGYIFERTSSSGANEVIGFVAPYNCRLEKFCFRSEIAQNGTFTLRVLESQDGTENPGTQIWRKDVSIDIADDTFFELDMTGAGIGSDYAPMTKGRIYAFQMQTPSNASDVNITMVLRHDITS